MTALIALKRAAKRLGGPAACIAPAGSRSDKMQRHPHTNAITAWMAIVPGGIKESVE
jgi:hypothetical protein